MTGTGPPNCAPLQICLIGGPVSNVPSVPPCTPPDTVIGTGMIGPNGQFTVPIAPPLELGDCIYAVCADEMSAVACVFPTAPAPALSPRALLLALGALMLVALAGFLRLRRTSSH